MRQSNVALDPIQVKFCTETLRPRGFGGYFFVTWAGSAGSGRAFYRLILNAHTSMVLMVWEGSDPDWDNFLAMDKIQQEQNLVMLPAIIGYDRELGLALVGDGGDRRLIDILFAKISEEKRIIILKSVMDQLISWQNCHVPTESRIGQRALDREQFLWETGYFKEHICGLMPELSDLFNDDFENERMLLADRCDSIERTLLHRDFQSENIVVKNQVISFVDFQGARMGPPEYDLASLLYDPYLGELLTKNIRKQVLEYYESHRNLNRENLAYCGCQRLMQALGAYGNLSMNRGKPRYRQYVKPALINLKSVVETVPELRQVRVIVVKALEVWDNQPHVQQNESMPCE